MATNLRFSTGIEILALMAAKPEQFHSSQTLAVALSTNPVVVRRLLAALGKAELVSTSKGPSGGSKLSRSPKQITLRDIFRAVGSSELLHQTTHGEQEMQDLRRAIHGIFRKAQKSFEEELSSVTLNQVMKKADKKAAKHSGEEHPKSSSQGASAPSA